MSGTCSLFYKQMAAGQWPSLENYLSGASPVLPSGRGAARFDGDMALSQIETRVSIQNNIIMNCIS